MHPLIYVPRRSLVVPDRAPRRLGCGVGCGVGGSPPPWTPAALGASLKAWLRADMGITLNGSNVAAWDDKSGNANGVAQGTDALRPTISTMAGVPALLFTRTAFQRMGATLAAPLTGATDWTLFCAIQPATTTTSAQHICCVGNRAADGYAVGIKLDNVNATRQGLACSREFWQDGAATTSVEIWVMRNTAASVRTLRVNGADAGMISTTNPAAPTTPFWIGSGYDSNTGTFGGKIAEVGVVASALAGDDLAKLESYLRGRYGV